VTKESTIDMNRVRCLLAILLAGALALGTPRVLAAAELSGQVVFTNLAIPGVTVTATRGEELVTTSTDPMGVFQFPSLDEGTWTVEVRMVGFAPITREIAVGPDTTPSTWELTLLSFEEITRDLPDPAAAPTQVDEPTGDGSGGARIATSTGVPDSTAGGFQRAGVASAPAVAQAAPADAEPVDASQAADGFLVNGSVNNGASTPFALQAAFGNNRISRGGRYSGTAGVLGSSSAWDARPYSLTGLQTARPDYHNVHYQLTFGGPLPLPGVRQPLQFFVGYQRTTNDTSSTQPALVPTALERAGDFSGSRTALGQPVQVVDPETGQPFPGGVIPAERISPQARALLGYYPDPAIANAGNRFNFEAPLLGGQTRDAVQVRLTKTVAGNPFQGTINWDRSVGDSTTLFGFDSENRSSGVQTGLTWNRRVGFRNNLRGSYQFSRQTSRSVPYFANRVNVSGEAGIAGNNQDPVNWGPPSLVFSSGLAGLSDTQPQRSRTTTQGGGLELFMNRGRHNVTYGGNLRRHDVDLLSQPNPRGTFTFSGTATGSDFADFLLGLPSASAISYGVAETNLRGFSYDAYVTDDWRVGPGLTLTLGVRWEYESPYSEEAGHLVNLDVAPDFSAVAPVLATDALGALTGRRYAGSLVDGDWGGVQPRLALAWRPLPGSSLVVRAGYGIYRNTGVYQTIARPATTRRAPYQSRTPVPAAASISVMGAASARASSARMKLRKYSRVRPRKRARSTGSAAADFTRRIPATVSEMCALTSPPRWSTRRSRRLSTATSGPQIAIAAGMTMNAASVSRHEIRSIAATATANSKPAESSRDSSAVTSVRINSTSVVRRLTIWPVRMRPKNARSSPTRWPYTVSRRSRLSPCSARASR
jgi:hypothetical protein